MAKSYILSFNSTSYAIAAEQKMMRYFNITVIPTPREITQNCGLSIKINDNNERKIIDTVKSMGVPCVLYRMGSGTPHTLEKILIVA